MENQSININPAAMFMLSYGLFVLTARDGDKDNGCIINTAAQLTATPLRISITVNKANFTHGMIIKTGEFNVSVLDQSAPFALFERFGFQSGKDADKFAGSGKTARAANGIRYLPEHANASISAKVKQAIDCGTHTLFIADVTETLYPLSELYSATYQYYFDKIKPKPPVEQKKKKGFVCKICGYVHEGDSLPEGFVCPICKHGAADFEPL
jgi:flavin reductase (DIM6/NTAB) family NADH-FMN oxidoreductase RutF